MKNLLLLIVFSFVLMGCGQTIVLLPDLDGNVGKVIVTPHGGEPVILDKPLQSVAGGNKVTTMTEAEVQSTFSDALAAQPEPTARFLLYFFHDSSRLKPASVKLLPEIMRTYTERSSTDVSVIGHTDALGDKTYNYGLSLRRANKIGKTLIKNGIPKEQIQIISHGEENPLVPSADGRSEPKNRRVEVLIR